MKHTKKVSYDDFRKIDLRVGTVLTADYFPEAKKPAYKLTIDLGGLGAKKSSVQITKTYTLDELVGKQVICVVNLGEKRIGPLFLRC